MTRHWPFSMPNAASSDSAIISVRQLGKQYLKGEMSSYGTVRDVIHDVVNHRMLRRPMAARPRRREAFWAIRDISFEVFGGEVVGIIGHNGAGKSTLLKVLSRVTLPTEGSAEIVGRVGSLLEVGTGFHPDLTGRENVFFSGAVLGMETAEVRRKFDEIVAFAGVAGFIDTPIKHYSSGMQVRLGFSVAAHLEPEVLIIDEVLAVGDESFQQQCLKKIEEVAARGLAVLLVSHNMASVARLCNTAHVFEGGRLVGSGHVADVVDLYRRRSTSLVKELTGDAVSVGGWRVGGTAESSRHRVDGAGPVEIDVDMELSREVKMARFALSVTTPGGVCAWSGDSGRERHDLVAGRYSLAYELASLPLRTGAYTLSLSVTHGDMQESATFVMQPELVLGQPNGSPPRRDGAVLDVPFEVRLAAVGDGG